MKSFNVIIENINTREFVPYDIIPYLIQCYKECRDEKPVTFKEFKDFIQRWSMYQWWARCEYEVVLKSWPPAKSVEKKIDVHWQVMLNIDRITEIVMEEVNGTKV